MVSRAKYRNAGFEGVFNDVFFWQITKTVLDWMNLKPIPTEASEGYLFKTDRDHCVCLFKRSSAHLNTPQPKKRSFSRQVPLNPVYLHSIPNSLNTSHLVKFFHDKTFLFSITFCLLFSFFLYRFFVILLTIVSEKPPSPLRLQCFRKTAAAPKRKRNRLAIWSRDAIEMRNCDSIMALLYADLSRYSFDAFPPSGCSHHAREATTLFKYFVRQ